MAKAKASSKLQALPTSPPLAHTLPSDAVLDALKMILLGAPLNEVLTTITRLIEAHSTGMRCSISLLDEDGLHLHYGAAPNLPEAYRAANVPITEKIVWTAVAEAAKHAGAGPRRSGERWKCFAKSSMAWT